MNCQRNKYKKKQTAIIILDFIKKYLHIVILLNLSLILWIWLDSLILSNTQIFWVLKI